MLQSVASILPNTSCWPICVSFLVLQQVLKEPPRDIIPHGGAMRGRLLIESTRGHLTTKIALDYLRTVLPMCKESSVCILGEPSRKIIRSINLSA